MPRRAKSGEVEEHQEGLERKLEGLHDRVLRGAYRAPPSCGSTYETGRRQRLLAVAAREDKIVQRVVVAPLNANHEEDFLANSTGSGRDVTTMRRIARRRHPQKKGSRTLDADIQSFFDTVNQEGPIRFVEHRIADRRIIRLIRKWSRRASWKMGS